MVIGVLALQGSVLEHSNIIRSQNDDIIFVQEPNDLNKIEGLIIPGGESTTLIRLLKIKGLDKAIVDHAKKGLKIWGTCAGLILLSKKLSCNSFKPLGLIDIVVDRNSYGSQYHSFEADLSFLNESSRVKFIRAPRIKSIGGDVKELSFFKDEVVAVQSNNILATTFHPEVTNNSHFYNYFKNMV